ncbi:MFS transporter [Haloarcula japonica]|uniref:Sugar transporter n=1 Tax=Haloarcula japonica (strain ATCC 49778 / DSM 6131 / JCM 7785 / NBRC 101032 / NCIMB 13157 / TR-1) TaxID=1227453 RepID=M0L7C5_HALJT|nr:MFS transporter [Haloarcula japonica]EMA29451.1 sugar transporter [Haloarcula japonica DSM 6131]
MTDRTDRGVLAGVIFAVLLAQVLLYPGVDRLVRSLGATTDLNASMWFLAAEFGAFVVFAGVWGVLSDATGQRTPYIAGGAGAGAVLYALIAWLPGAVSLPFTGVLVLRVLQGGATIAAFSLAMTMLMDLGGGHGKNMGAAGIAIGSGTALGAPLGGQLYEVQTTLPLYVASTLSLVVAVAALLVTDRAPSDERSGLAATVSGLKQRPTLGVPYAFGFIDRLTAGFFALVGTLYFRETFELGPSETGIMLALFFAPFALLQYPFGVLSDRIGRTVPIVLGSVLYGLTVIGVGQAPTVTIAGAGMVLTGVIGALMAPATMALVSDLAGETERGTAMAGFNIFGSVGFLAGILIGGTVAGVFGYPVAFLVAGGTEVVLAVLALPGLLRLEKPAEDAVAG